jgi:hypothetical protein
MRRVTRVSRVNVVHSMAVATMDVDPEEQLSFLRTCHLNILIQEQLASLNLNAQLPTHLLSCNATLPYGVQTGSKGNAA